MKQFSTVLKFELSHYMKSKAYIIVTAVLVALVAGVLTYPRVSALFARGGEKPPAERQKMALSDYVYGGALLEDIKKAYPAFDMVLVDEDAPALKSKVVSGEYAAAVVIESPLKFEYIASSVSMYENPQGIIGGILKEKYQMDRLKGLGLSGNEAASLINPNVEVAVTVTGKSQSETIIYTYVLIYALYIAILLYGQFVATSVAVEKSSRAMELLITSADPASLLFGKVVGSGLAGLVQFAAIFGSAFLFYRINAGAWGDAPAIRLIFNMPASLLLYALLFFVVGFFLYSFIYGALGSLASRTEDVNTAIMPVTFLFIIAFFIVIYGMGSGKLDSPLMVACSFIPFTSPMVMFTRIAMSEVPPVQIAVSVAIAVLATVGVGYLSAAIYRLGVLMYGKPPRLGEVIRTLRARSHGTPARN